jgi:hypothetical protein
MESRASRVASTIRQASRLLFEHWLKIKNRAALAVKREASPRSAIKEFKQKRLAI